jgi:hypothetical protein
VESRATGRYYIFISTSRQFTNSNILFQPHKNSVPDTLFLSNVYSAPSTQIFCFCETIILLVPIKCPVPAGCLKNILFLSATSPFMSHKYSIVAKRIFCCCHTNIQLQQRKYSIPSHTKIRFHTQEYSIDATTIFCFFNYNISSLLPKYSAPSHSNMCYFCLTKPQLVEAAGTVGLMDVLTFGVA